MDSNPLRKRDKPLLREQVFTGSLVYWHGPSLFGQNWSSVGRIHSTSTTQGSLNFSVLLFDSCTNAKAVLPPGEKFHPEMNTVIEAEALAFVRKRIGFVAKHGVSKDERHTTCRSLLAKLRRIERELDIEQHCSCRRLGAVHERLDRGRSLCNDIEKDLPAGLVGVVAVNATTGEWFNAQNKDAGWKEARKKWGENIAAPPLWMIMLTPEHNLLS